jgi:streptomycin 3"-adenylyltransferase
MVVRDGVEPAALDRLAHTLANVDPDPAVGVEASVVRRADAALPRAPWPFELHVATGPGHPKVVQGRGHRGDPDLILHYAVTRAHGWCATGPPAAQTFGEIDRSTIVDQLTAELRWAVSNSTTSYAVLNACRALCFVADGTLVSKTDGGRWALEADIAPDLVRQALRARTGEADTTDPTDTMRWVRSVAERLEHRDER